MKITVKVEELVRVIETFEHAKNAAIRKIMDAVDAEDLTDEQRKKIRKVVLDALNQTMRNLLLIFNIRIER